MPKENRTPVLFDTFAKVNEDTDVNKLQQGELPRLEDGVLDRAFGKVKSRGGFSIQSGLSLSPSGLGRIINVKDNAGTPYLIAGDTGSIYLGNTSFSATIKTGLSGKARFGYAQMDDELIITNGAQKPFVVTGAGFTTNYNLELQRPDVRTQIAQLTTGNVGLLRSNSNYKWIWVYVTDTGEKSMPSLPFTYGNGGTLAGQRQVLFSNIEVPTDPRITSKWLYRTEGGTAQGTALVGTSDSVQGAIYYLVNKFEPSVTQVIDGIPDTELDFSELIVIPRVPVKADYAVTSNNRLFFGGITVDQKYYNPPTQRGQNKGSATVVNGVTYDDYTIPSGGARYDILSATTTAVGQATGLTQNYYYSWAITFVDKNGFESDPIYTNVYQPTGASGNYVQPNMLVTGAPSQVSMCDAYLGSSSRIDPNAVERRIYRNIGTAVAYTDPTTKNYYLVQSDKYDPLDTTQRRLPDFIDTVSDATLAGNDQLVLTNYKTFDSGITWSQPDKQAFIRLENVRQVFEEDGDPIVGMFDDGNGVLIFKTNSIVKLYHTGAPENWYIRKVWLEHGCDNEKSLLKAGDVYYFQYRKRNYAMPTGGQPQYIGFGKQKTFDLHTILDGGANDEWLTYATQYGSNYYLLTYDKKIQTWYQFNLGTKATPVLWFHKYTDAYFTSGQLCIMTDRRICKYDESLTQDTFVSGATSNITVTVQLPRIHMPDYSLAKIRNVVMNVTRTSTVTLQVTSDTTTFSAVNLPASLEVPARMVGVNGRVASLYFDLTLSGIFQYLDYIRVDLRPVRQGVGF